MSERFWLGLLFLTVFVLSVVASISIHEFRQHGGESTPVAAASRQAGDSAPRTDGGITLHEPDQDGITLTAEEYEQLKQVIAVGGATPLQVALVNIASLGTRLFVVSLVVLAVFLIYRKKFDFLWDQDIWDDTWASVAVICMCLLVLGWVITAAVRG